MFCKFAIATRLYKHNVTLLGLLASLLRVYTRRFAAGFNRSKIQIIYTHTTSIHCYAFRIRYNAFARASAAPSVSYSHVPTQLFEYYTIIVRYRVHFVDVTFALNYTFARASHSTVYYTFVREKCIPCQLALQKGEIRAARGYGTRKARETTQSSLRAKAFADKRPYSFFAWKLE